MTFFNSSKPEVILDIENDPSRKNQNYNLINRRIMAGKVYIVIMIQTLVTLLLALIFFKR